MTYFGPKFRPIQLSRSAFFETFLTIFFLLALFPNQNAFADDYVLSKGLLSSSSVQSTRRALAAFYNEPIRQRNSDFMRGEEDSALLRTSRSGFTFDPCSSDNDCMKPRKCTIFNRFFQEVRCNVQNASIGCTCDWERPCKKRADCPKGEICTGLKIFGRILSTSCASEVVAVDKPELIPLGNGLTMDECRSDSNCHKDRLCVKRLNKRLKKCKDEDKNCFCFRRPPRRCVVSSECDLGERCAKISSLPFSICVSDAVVSKRKTVLAVGGALGLKSCSHSTDCAGDRSCLVALRGRTDFCIGRKGCFCGYSFKSCSFRGKLINRCYKGEICVGIKNRRLTRCAAKEIVSDNPNLVPVNKGGTFSSRFRRS